MHKILQEPNVFVIHKKMSEKMLEKKQLEINIVHQYILICSYGLNFFNGSWEEQIKVEDHNNQL